MGVPQKRPVGLPQAFMDSNINGFPGSAFDDSVFEGVPPGGVLIWKGQAVFLRRSTGKVFPAGATPLGGYQAGAFLSVAGVQQEPSQ